MQALLEKAQEDERVRAAARKRSARLLAALGVLLGFGGLVAVVVFAIQPSALDPTPFAAVAVSTDDRPGAELLIPFRAIPEPEVIEPAPETQRPVVTRSSSGSAGRGRSSGSVRGSDLF